MSKIDTSTYDLIKSERKEPKFNMQKGLYGYAKRYKNRKLFFTLILFGLILSDVMFSIIAFQTRKTWFVIIACVLAIPFARNLIDYFMAFKANPLRQEDYEETVEITNHYDKALYYDISITEESGVVFVPCLCVYNNNIIAYTPDVKLAKEREKIKKYIDMVNSAEEDRNYRIFVTEKISTFDKEISKLKNRSDETAEKDEETLGKLLSMGF